MLVTQVKGCQAQSISEFVASHAGQAARALNRQLPFRCSNAFFGASAVEFKASHRRLGPGALLTFFFLIPLRSWKCIRPRVSCHVLMFQANRPSATAVVADLGQCSVANFNKRHRSRWMTSPQTWQDQEPASCPTGSGKAGASLVFGEIPI